ncbi:acyl-CoA dehydrogenase family protein [Ilumatobacter coccineus]|uniref:Putative acyl-CoA dehydrogenase n=1 Tax=Ilumatobacter coccineus (strain NBRC 103263 / KCTC 29153 / YM16-304) TaxID=1313172 RepID=A0A6C7E8D4_ILUCY|nr:acyl-CoA dehydrogenase family protein [Ilumatobacter coccineus]BAN02977.1 putative acyl-CoA dehydrogenase [Ilumatobacter coccineus YM16-304]
MNFSLTDEQEQLQDVVRGMLADRAPLTSVRKVTADEAGFDRSLWSTMATDVGLHGLAIPEMYGGSGYSFVELAIVLKEMGRVLLPGPFFSSAVLAAQVLLACDDEAAKRDVLTTIASGEQIATVAYLESESEWSTSAAAATARLDGDDHRITGSKQVVTDAHHADVLLVTATTDDGVTIFAVDAQADGVSVRLDEPMDPTRPVSAVEFADSPGRPMCSLGSGGDALAAALHVVAAGLACEQAGAAQAALEMATEYAKNRKQFDRAIGSFQAIKHMLADVLLDNESADAAAFYAAAAVGDLPDEVAVTSSLALAFASDALLSAAETNVQVHGGIGFTWEHDAHYLIRRALTSRQLLGSAQQHRESLAQHLLDRDGTRAS